MANPAGTTSEAQTFRAVLATVLELPPETVPAAEGWRLDEGDASRPVLRPLAHRGGLRADILDDGLIRVGGRVDAGQPAVALRRIANRGAPQSGQ